MVVYYLRNKITGKMYIGATHYNYLLRIRAHLRRYHMKNSALSKDVLNFGAENFSHGILCECSSQEDMHEKEKFWISKYPKDELYNRIKSGVPKISLTRSEKLSASRIGILHSDETKNKISATKTGVKVWPNGRPLEQMKNAIQKSCEVRRKKIMCLNNGVVYGSLQEAADNLGLTKASVSKVATGKRKQCHGYRFLFIK